MMLMLVCLSCQNQVEQVAGSYSYKISGRASVLGVEQSLSDEMGAMEILSQNSQSAMFTFNAMGGPAYYTTATITGKQIEINSFERYVSQAGVNYKVKVTGSGTVYDKSIIINLRYNGSTLKADSLVLLCKKN